MISRTITIAKTILIAKLERELQAVGIPTVGVALESATELRIDYTDAATEGQRTTETDAVIAAHDATNNPITVYLNSHVTQYRRFVKILYTLDNGIRNNAATLANVRIILADTLTQIATLPAAYTNHFDKMRTLHGVTADPSTLTLVQCAELEDVIRSWINTRLLFAMIANGNMD